MRLRADRDEGQVLVIIAVAMIVFLAMASLVLDLAAARQDQRTNTTAADLAAVSAANDLDPLSGGSALTACNEAWSYLTQNLPDLPSGSSFPCASIFGTPPACAITPPDTLTSPEVGRNNPQTFGPYTITMFTPVSDTDSVMTDSSGVDSGETVQYGESAHDGTPCERFGIIVHRSQAFLFGKVVGVGTGGATVNAVARYSIVAGGLFPALTALDPSDCQTINANSGFIDAYQTLDPKTGLYDPGIIYADSSASCSNSKPVIDVNTQNGTSSKCAKGTQAEICAQAGTSDPGVIAAVGSPVYRTGYNYFVGTTAGAWGGATPTSLAKPITRAPVDSIYNCASSTSGCNFISQLTTKFASGQPTGYSVVSSCTLTGTTLKLTSNTYVNCPGGYTIKNGGSLQITAGIAVVFAGGLSFQSSGNQLCVVVSGVSACDQTIGDYSSPPLVAQPSDTLLYFQNSGSLDTSSGGTVVLPYTFGYSGTGSGGCLNIGSGSSVTWSAAFGANPSWSPVSGATSDPYSKLMFWSEGSCASTFTGGGSLSMDGILFMPNSDFTISGNSPVDARQVQFWVHTIALNGSNSGLKLQPDPSKAIPIAGGVALIR